jgi:hypothetical protein
MDWPLHAAVGLGEKGHRIIGDDIPMTKRRCNCANHSPDTEFELTTK